MTIVQIFPTPEMTARALARKIVEAADANPRLVIGLPTGRTPIPLYNELAAAYRRRDVDFAQVATFNLDEFAGIGGTDPRSYRAFMREHLFRHINVPTSRTHFLNGRAASLQRECARYERAIERAGGIDLQILGLGANGHIGFNEPGDHLIARTHVTRLTKSTRSANAPLFGNRIRDVPREALSMGIATILQARRIVLLATGREKSRGVERMLRGPVTPHLPASFLQLHRNVEVWLDRASGEDLRRRRATRGRSGPSRPPDVSRP
jgi:glucosamine-6-phosphate deaminase